MNIHDEDPESRDAVAQSRAKQKQHDDETTFYQCFRTPDGREVLRILREQLRVEEGVVSLQGREDATINAQRDIMKHVYWMIWGLAEAGARRKGDTLVRPTG